MLVKNKKFNEAVSFSQQFLIRFNTPQNREELQKVMGVLAYVDIESSPVAYLLSPQHRYKLANQINNAILECDGISNSSALERLIRQLLSTYRTRISLSNNNRLMPLEIDLK